MGSGVAAEPLPIPAGPCSVLQSSINSLKKGPKLLKWFPASPLPQRTLQPQPRIPQAGRSQSGQRMPSLPCELSCGWAPPMAGHLSPPVHTRLWPLLPSPAPTWSCAAVSPWKHHCVCSQASHSLGPALATFSLGGGTMSLQLQTLSLCPPAPSAYFLQEKLVAGPAPGKASPLGFLWSLTHREGARTPTPCPAQQASPALLCPPWSQKGQVCSRGLGLAPHCCSLTSIGTSVGSVVPAGGVSHLPPA